MLVSVGREEKSWECSPVWSKISPSQNQTHWIESEETLQMSTSQPIASLLMVKIPTHLVSEVFLESDMRAEEKQNKCVSERCSGLLPMSLAVLKVCFLFFLQDFWGFSHPSPFYNNTQTQIHLHHIYTFFLVALKTMYIPTSLFALVSKVVRYQVSISARCLMTLLPVNFIMCSQTSKLLKNRTLFWT